jgi:hypothetical protein
MRRFTDPTLVNLRRARSRVHRVLDRLEPQLAAYQTKLADLNTRIQAIAPELQLHPRRYIRALPFARGELPRLVMDILREAGGPVAVRTIAVRVLAAKGITLPDRRTMKATRTRIGQTCIVWQRRGLVVKVGEGKAGMKALSTDRLKFPRA